MKALALLLFLPILLAMPSHEEKAGSYSLEVSGSEPPYYVGEAISLEGTVSYDGRPYDGTAILNISKNGRTYLSTSLMVDRGNFDVLLTPPEPGEYALTLEFGKTTIVHKFIVKQTSVEILKSMFTLAAFTLVLLLGVLSFLNFRDGIYKALWVVLLSLALFVAVFSFF